MQKHKTMILGTLCVLLSVLGACGDENEDSKHSESPASEHSDAETGDARASALTCEEIAIEARGLREDPPACEVDQDCFLAEALGGCNVAVHRDDAADMTRLAREFQNQRCGFSNCAPLDWAACKEGRCEGGFGARLPGKSCEEILELYRDKILEHSTCEEDTDCRNLDARYECVAGDLPTRSGCGVFANRSLERQELRELEEAFENAGCTSERSLCTCTNNVPRPSCVEGVCGTEF